MLRSLSCLFLSASLFASLAATAAGVPSSATPVTVSQSDINNLVPYRIDVTRPNEAPQSATLLTAVNTPVEFKITRSESYIKEVCRGTQTTTMSEGTSACDQVNPAAMPVGGDQAILTPGVITTGLQLTLTRHSDGDSDYLQIKSSNSILEALRNVSYDMAAIQVPITRKKESDQTYRIVSNHALVLDLGYGARVTITRAADANDAVARFDLPKNANDGASVQRPTVSEKTFDQPIPVVQTIHTIAPN